MKRSTGESMQGDKLKGHLAIAAAYVIFGLNIVFCKDIAASGTVSPYVLFTLRAFGAGLALRACGTGFTLRTCGTLFTLRACGAGDQTCAARDRAAASAVGGLRSGKAVYGRGLVQQVAVQGKYIFSHQNNLLSN